MPPPVTVGLDSPRLASLAEVNDESPGPASPSPYYHPSMSGSATTFKGKPSTSSLSGAITPSVRGPRNPSNLRQASISTIASRSSPVPQLGSDTASITQMSIANVMTPTGKKRDSSPSTATVRESRNGSTREQREGKEHQVTAKGSRALQVGQPKIRTNPHLPNSKDAELAPATMMYWSRAPVYGQLPNHGLRAKSVTLVDSMAWVFGGCDEVGCWKDVWCLNTETMQWTHPEMIGDVPPPCRAHTATLVDRRIVVFGGGEGPVYYNALYVLDTFTRRWQQPEFPKGMPIPPPRRAHTAVLYRGRIYVFGGGNGSQALNDVWALDVGSTANVEKMRWEKIKTDGDPPSPRGYHTANLIGSVMVVVGGSDGKDCFADMWALDLDTMIWRLIFGDTKHRRLSHTATQVGSYLFIWGGHDGTTYTSELLLFNLVSLSFEDRPVYGRPPTARGYHAAVVADSRLFVFGGFNGNEVFDDVHILDLAGAAYLPQVTSFRIELPPALG